MTGPVEPNFAPDLAALAGQYPEYVAALTETTVLPYFVSQMTSNALVIGLSPAIAWLGLHLPQLFGAFLVHSQARRKPYILTVVWLERGILLLMFGITLTAGWACWARRWCSGCSPAQPSRPTL